MEWWKSGIDGHGKNEIEDPTRSVGKAKDSRIESRPGARWLDVNEFTVAICRKLQRKLTWTKSSEKSEPTKTTFSGT